MLALSKRWPEAEAAYRFWYAERDHNDFRLGSVQLVAFAPQRWVANMVGQSGTRSRVGPHRTADRE